MTGVAILVGTVAMVTGLIYGANWVGRATERHTGVGIVAFVAVIVTLIGSVWLYGRAVRWL